MASPRESAGRRSEIVEIGAQIASAYEKGFKAAELAHASTAAAARGLLDQADTSAKTLQASLDAANLRISKLTEEQGSLLRLCTSLSTTYSAKEVLDARQKIEELKIKHEAEWKVKLVELAGPNIEPTLKMLVARFSPGGADPDVAVARSVITEVMMDNDICDRIRDKVGSERWGRTMAFLGRMMTGEPPP